jgi:hypothetical protein
MSNEKQPTATRPVKEEDLTVWDNPTIAEQLPVSFSNDAKWTSITGHCNGCAKDIPQSHFRGRIERSWPKVAVVNAIGFCEECQLLTPYHMRLHDDMRMTYEIEHGKWYAVQLKPDGLRSQVLSFFKRIFGK